jgi:hypothetical protein
MSRSTRLFLVVGALAAASACQDARSPLAPEARSASAISLDRHDDDHGGGSTGGFVFLEPIGDEPSHLGTFDRTLSPEVKICEWTGTQCGATVADFTMSGGTGGTRIKVDGEKYQVVWSTKTCVTGRCTLDPTKAYRINVLVGSVVVGFADVTIAGRSGSCRSDDDDDYHHDGEGHDGDRHDGPHYDRGHDDGDHGHGSRHHDGCGTDRHYRVCVTNGSSLPIKFRIDRGTPGAVIVTPPPATVVVGTPVPLTALVTDLHGATLTPSITWTSSDPTVATVDQNGNVTTIGVGTATITASVGDLSSSTNVTVISAGVPGCLAPPAGIVSWWTGDGNANDYMHRNNAHGSPTLSYSTGVVGQAFALNGADASADIPFSPSLDFSPTGQFSIEGWVNPAEQNAYEAIFVKSPADGHWDYGLYLNPNNDHQVFVYAYTPNSFMSGFNQDHVVSSTTTTTIGQWFHVAVTYDNGSWVMYVNGVPEATRSGEFITQSTGGLAIGKKGEAPYDPFHGLLDEITIYNRTLPATDVAAIYAAGGAGKCKL